MHGCFGVCEDTIAAIISSYKEVRRETANRELIEDNLSSKGEPAGFNRAHSGEAESDGDTDLAAGSPLAKL